MAPVSAAGSAQGGLFDLQQAPPPSHRLFFALVPPEHVRDRFAATAESLRRQGTMAGRWVRPSRYHLTLAFLGDHVELRDALLRPMLAAAAVAAAQVEPFAWQVDEIISFRGRQPPCVLHSSAASEPMRALWACLRQSLMQAGLRIDGHGFEPHVTLAYGEALLPAPQPVSAVAWPVTSFRLLHGIVGGRDYESLGEWSLGG